VRACSADGLRPGVDGAPSGVEEGVPLVVDADAHLTVTGSGPGVVDGGAHDRLEQPPLVRQRRPAPLAGDLGDRAAEVHVDVVGQVAPRPRCAPRGPMATGSTP
jgi:hypothetical protein